MNTREMSGKFQDWQQKATDAAKNMGTVTDRYVRDNTWATVAIAAVVGCAIGYLLAGSREEED